MLPEVCQTVEINIPKKRGRKKKSDIKSVSPEDSKKQTKARQLRNAVNSNFNEDLICVTPSTRRTRAMSEEDLTPPEIVGNSDIHAQLSNTPEKAIKSILKSSPSSLLHVKHKVKFDLPDPIYDSFGNEVVKE